MIEFSSKDLRVGTLQVKNGYFKGIIGDKGGNILEESCLFYETKTEAQMVIRTLMLLATDCICPLGEDDGEETIDLGS